MADHYSTGNPLLDTFERIFNGDGGDYQFTMSHVAISGRDVEVQLERGVWVLTQREGNLRWTARHGDKVCAVLLLIAARMGYVGEFRSVDDD